MADVKRREVIATAELLLNVSGSLEHPDHYRAIPCLAYIDTDPVVTQTKFVTGAADFAPRVDEHDVHFSFGERFTDVVPDTGHTWQPTRQPIVLSEWPPLDLEGEAFTTVMSWTSYAPLRWQGRIFGQKDVEFQQFLDLPQRVAPIPMQVAMSPVVHTNWQAAGQDGSPHELLARAGWGVVDADAACGDLDGYRDFIRSSRAEWSVAKNAYVQGRPAWLSERSACYLAAGRPVVVQDTGFGHVLPVGEGLLPFRTPEQAADAVRDVDRNYAAHARAARAIAEAHFDSDNVLTRLIDRALAVGAADQRTASGRDAGPV